MKKKINWDNIALVPNEMVFEGEESLAPYKMYLVDRSLISSGRLDSSNAKALEMNIVYGNSNIIINNHHGIKTVVLVYRKDVGLTKSDIDYLISGLSHIPDRPLKYEVNPISSDKYIVRINWKEVRRKMAAKKSAAITPTVRQIKRTDNVGALGWAVAAITTVLTFVGLLRWVRDIPILYEMGDITSMVMLSLIVISLMAVNVYMIRVAANKA